MNSTKLLTYIVCLGVCVAGCQSESSDPPEAGSIPSNSATTSMTNSNPTTSSTTISVARPTITAPSISSGPIFQGGRQSLTLADARATNDWKEGSFNIPSGTEPVKAIASTLDCYSDPVLEFRFSRQPGNLVVNVAQDLDSKSSNMTVEFTMYADGRSVDVKQIDFASNAQLVGRLDGVSVIKIAAKAKASSGSCQDTTALLTSVNIEP